MQEAIEVGYQVEAVHSQKVILTCSKLDRRLRRAIGHAHDAERARRLTFIVLRTR